MLSSEHIWRRIAKEAFKSAFLPLADIRRRIDEEEGHNEGHLRHHRIRFR
jgi:hypothetical protein